MRKIAILCLLLVGALPALAGSYRPDEIPNVQRMDRRRYVSNPDGILSAGAVARIDSPVSYTHLTLPTILRV